MNNVEKLLEVIKRNLDVILDIFGIIFDLLSGNGKRLYKHAVLPVKRAARALAIVASILVAFVCLSVYFRWEQTTVILGFVSSLFFLVSYLGGDMISRVMVAAHNPDPTTEEGITAKAKEGARLAGNAIANVGKELKNLFIVFALISGGTALLGLFVATWGFPPVWMNNLAMVVMLIVFFTVRGVFLKTSPKLTMRAMTILVLATVITYLGKGTWQAGTKYYQTTDNTVVRGIRSTLDGQLSNLRRESSIKETKASATYAMVSVEKISFLEEATLDSTGQITALKSIRIANFKVQRAGQDTVVNELLKGDLILIADELNRGAKYRTERYVQVYLPDETYGMYAYGKSYFVRHALLQTMDGLALAKQMETFSEEEEPTQETVMVLWPRSVDFKLFEGKWYELPRNAKIDFRGEGYSVIREGYPPIAIEQIRHQYLSGGGRVEMTGRFRVEGKKRVRVRVGQA